MAVKVKIRKRTFKVAEKCDVEIWVTCDKELRPGDAVEVQFPNSWMLIRGPSYTRKLQTRNAEKEHYVHIAPETARGEFKIKIKKRHLVFPGGTVRHGRHIIAKLSRGKIPPGSPVKILYANTYSPYVAETETVWLRVKGEQPYAPPVLKTTAGEAEYMRILVPSGAEPGEQFSCLVVSLDKFENCSTTRYKNLRLKLSDGRTIAGNLSFTGKIRVPVTLGKEGIYRFSANRAISNAVRVKRGARGPYWGDIHIHTKLSHDAQGNAPYEYARDTANLDFAGTADHWESMGKKGIQQAARWAKDFNRSGEFAAIPGYERNPASLGGHHNIYFKTEEEFLEKALGYTPGVAKREQEKQEEWKKYKPHSAMIIPHHTGIHFSSLPAQGKGAAIDINACDDKGLRPVAEIYSHHGQSESYSPGHLLAYEINRMRNPERRANTSMPGPYYLQDYWKQGKKIGVIASSDEHSGQGGRRHGGVTAVRAGELSRGAIFDAIRSRRCYATTGERILIDFSVARFKMGSAGNIKKGGKINIILRVWGTEKLLRVDILRLRFGKDGSFIPLESIAPRPETLDFTVRAKDRVEHDSVYYARIVQEPLEWPGMAWTSPVWINCR